MPPASSSPTFDLIGVGAPIMDIVAAVPESFLANVSGEKGGMVMVDADEIAQLVALLPESPALTPGGSAANTTFNATRLGLRTAFVGKLGGDEFARLYLARFAAIGVNTERYKRSSLPNARSLILTTPDAQRTMRTCLGAVLTLSPDEIRVEDFRGARHVHIEGYVVFNRALADAILRAARAAKCTISLDLVFANEDEIRALFPEALNADYATLAQRLAALGCTAAVKLGKDGAWIARGDELHLIAPHRIPDAIDSNGAGDAWAAGFLAGYLRDLPLPACGAIASILGAETVRHMGPIIPDAFWPLVLEKTRAIRGAV